jgi:fermentation-respiration switch protein FrsA (DUF1100 family)
LLDKYLIYFPERGLAGTPADVGLEFEDVFFSASDGIRLHGWFVPARSDVTLIYFHGNAGNIGHRVDIVLMLHQRLDVNVFIFDYRGYGRSEGSPSERGFYLDAEAALGYLGSRQDIVQSKLVFYGHSIGAAVAVEMATRRQAQAVILESPFTSVKAMARRVYPLLSRIVPPGLVVNSKYDSLSKIKRVHSPVLVLHGDRDEIAPFEMGRELFEAANEPKRFYAIKGASHNDTHLAGGAAYYEAIKGFIDAS